MRRLAVGVAVWELAYRSCEHCSTGWHWKGRTGLAADGRILSPSVGGEPTLLKIAAHCDDRA
jgi:hypothetical protein